MIGGSLARGQSRIIVTSLLDRVRHHARRPISRTPYVWDAAMLARPEKRKTLVRPDTALLIEGFLRSGNTYSVAAFRVANGPGPHVARHLHGAPHVLRAARLGIPSLVLVRRPRDAVSSYLLRRPALRPRDALLEYVDFYRTAWPARHAFLVAAFDDVTHDFGSVLDQVNERFGTTFRRYEPTVENEAVVLALVEDMNREECGGELVETHVGRPSAERDARRRELDRLFHAPGTASALESADEWYRRYLALRATPSVGGAQPSGSR